MIDLDPINTAFFCSYAAACAGESAVGRGGATHGRDIAVRAGFASRRGDRPRSRGRPNQDWVLRGFRQFDAPASIIVTDDRALHGSDIPPFDCGAVVNCLVNAAWSRGLGCVINSQGIMQSPVVRAEARIPEDEVIQTCVAIGWPDETFPASASVGLSARAPRPGLGRCARAPRAPSP
jgi:hypothetical protein